MIFAGIRFLRHICLSSLPALATLALLPPAYAQAPTPKPPASPSQTQPADTINLPSGSSQEPLNSPDTNNLRPLVQDNTLLSVPGGQKLMSEASDAVSSQNYPLAAKKLQEARQVFNQLSNFYQELASSFSGIDNRIADTQRTKAGQSAEKRDEATYQLALVHRAQNQPELAVPLLVQIIRSQNPTRDLGKKAYQQLFELVFVDAPYPLQGQSQPTSSTK